MKAVLSLADMVVGLTLVALVLGELIEIIELLFRKPPPVPPVPAARAATPMVSFHVPICSEPPEVVARTLRALNALDYDHYEVLVVDNNTADERLWRPVEALCRDLGERFRFFHLPKWPGFKAGALNFALSQTSERAELIGVVDADYEIAPGYLSDAVPFFADDAVAFVQAPQDYRDWQHNTFRRACNWEYWQVFAVSMALRDRRNAILLHGTMSLVRSDALRRAGGWMEWCVTEDSELGLRLLADGWQSRYISRTYGHGLVPFTFRDYKGQRRRWVAGGAQQLHRHFALFAPWSPSGHRLTAAQKLSFLQGWLPWLRCAVIVLSAPLALALAFAALLGVASPYAGPWIPLGVSITLVHLLVRNAVIYPWYLKLTWHETVIATLAGLSLTWAIGSGWVSGFASREQPFLPTPKKLSGQPHWLRMAGAEAVLGGAALALAVAVVATFGAGAWPSACALSAYTAMFLPAVWMARRSVELAPAEDVLRSEADA